MYLRFPKIERFTGIRRQLFKLYLSKKRKAQVSYTKVQKFRIVSYNNQQHVRKCDLILIDF